MTTMPGECSAVISMPSESDPSGEIAAPLVAILVPDAALASAWILVLAATLQDRLSVATSLVTAEGANQRSTMTVPERLERRFTHTPTDFGRVVDARIVPLASLSSRPRIIIDVTGQPDPVANDADVLSPVLNGQPIGTSIVAALWDRQPPQLGVRLAQGREWKMLHGATVGIPDRELVTRALDAVFRRLVALLLEATAHLLDGRPLPALPVGMSQPSVPLAGGDLWRQVRHGYLPKAGRQLVKRLIREDWCIGYRRLTDMSRFPEQLDLNPETFTLLPSPSSHYYADPFLFEHDGDTFLFFEDYDYAVGRAHISYVTLGADGPSKPAVALMRPYHLSYPFMFAQAGRILMIPETSGCRRIELYEATSFPDTWRLHAVLLEDINAADVTLHQRNGRWWMFATVVEHDSSSWDTVSVFWADALEGPWHAHPMNPVKNDVEAARSAGALIEVNGRLLRPVQDCSQGYGSALAWCEIVELTEIGFAEVVIARHACPAGSRYYGLHTYNRTASFETVDLKRSRLR